MPKSRSNNIEVEVASFYVPEKSNPQSQYYFYAYKVRITNVGPIPAKLINRHWIITDGLGRTHEVKGEGVVGEQPNLAPGQSFEYTSYCPLNTPTGNMKGSYEFTLNNGEKFKSEIPLFVLSDPESYN